MKLDPRIIKLAKYICIVGIVTGILLLFVKLLFYFLPFSIAAVIAILIDPLVTKLQKRTKIRRGFVVFIVLFLLFSVLTFFVVMVVRQLTFEVIEISQEIPVYKNLMFSTMEKYINALQLVFGIKVTHDFPQIVDKNISNFLSTLSNKLGNMTKTLKKYILSVSNFIVFFIFSLLAAYSLSSDKDKIIGILGKVISPEKLAIFDTLRVELVNSLIGYIRAQIILSIISCIIVIIGLMILKIPFYLLIGIVIGFVDVLPVFGTGSIFWPWSIWLILSGRWKLGLAILAIHGVVTIVRRSLEPKVLSVNIGVDLLGLIFSMFLGLKVWGVIGLVAGPVVLVILNTMIKIGALKLIWDILKQEFKIVDSNSGSGDVGSGDGGSDDGGVCAAGSKE